MKRGGGQVYRPLPAVIALPGKNRTIQILAASRHQKKIGLASFDPAEIAALVKPYVEVPRDIVVLADCVFGLPSDMRRGNASLRQLLDRAARHDSAASEPLGRQRSAAFFRNILNEFTPDRHDDKKWPLRWCEQLASSNSVFQEHPFQKNIQSGTYRIWCELGRSLRKQNGHAVRFWPHDFTTVHHANNANDTHPTGAGQMMTIAEGYPSLYWKTFFGAKTRKPKDLRALSTAALKDLGWSLTCPHWEVITNDPDTADAAVLALAAFIMQSSSELFQRSLSCDPDSPATVFHADFEGWIAGVQ
jgi:hypothetical protein